MEKHWVKRGGKRVMIFVLGWSTDHKVVEHISPDGFDFLYIFDYRDFEPLTINERTQIETYSERYLIAWSFGVLVAERLFTGMDFTRAVAFNGTPYPIHDRFGIEPRRFSLTLRGLANGDMDMFNRRAYDEEYERLRDKLSPRTIQENIAELAALKEFAQADFHPSLHWDKAVIGKRDMIFPPQNMENYWRERAELLPLPHYPFADADIILREIDDR